jgi:hypothetical protein
MDKQNDKKNSNLLNLCECGIIHYSLFFFLNLINNVQCILYLKLISTYETQVVVVP